MRWFTPIRPALAAGLIALLAAGLLAQPDQADPPDDPKGVEVLTRGPVHEAYANPADARPEPSPVVEKEPPEVVDEVPPEERPEGDDVRWIPGYWHFDDEADEFLWISGFWRDLPPNHAWVPGGWHRAEGGWQWVSGFWAADEDEEVEYVPPPPETLERGPSTPAPDDDSSYVPGCWVYREERFNWRPGFWVRARPDWVYVSPSYTWTPAGCVFVDGYWDHPLHDRGLLFAPVRIERTLLARQWTYQPRYCVQPDALFGALFVRTATRHYFFGDYFGDRYAKRFVPWVDYRPARNQYDVNFSYYRRQFGSDRWETNVRDFYAARFRGDVPPPPRTLVQQNQFVNQFTVKKTQNVAVNKTFNITNIQNASVVTPITKINNTNVTALAALGRPVREGRPAEPPRADIRRVLKLEPVSKDQRKSVLESAARTREASEARRKSEDRLFSEAARRGDREGPPRATRAPLPPRPPAAAKPAPRPDTPTQPRKERPPAPKPPKPEARPVPPTPAPQPPGPRKDDRPDRPKQPPKDERPPTPRPPEDRPKPPRDERPKPPDAKPPAPKPPEPKPPAPKPDDRPRPPRDEKPKPPAPKPPAPKPPAPKADDRPKPPAPKPPAPKPPDPKPPAPKPPDSKPPAPKPPPKPDKPKDDKPPKPRDETFLRG